MKLSRNAPCPCGSGKKYKKCCLPANTHETIILENITQHPVSQCFYTPSLLETKGLCMYLIERKHASLPDTYHIFSFLVDHYCLGPKDCLYHINMDSETRQGFFDNIPYEMVHLEYEDLRNHILGSVQFAKSYHLPLSPEYLYLACSIEAERDYVYDEQLYGIARKGLWGKKKRIALYIPGLYDDINKIEQHLEQSGKPYEADDLFIFGNI